MVETLTAMMILVISLVTIMELFSGGLRSSWVSKSYTRAIYYAREKMEEVLLSTGMAEEERAGEFGDGYRWQITTEHINPPPEDGDDTGMLDPIDLFRVTVTIFWDSGQKKRHYSLETIHIAEKSERAGIN